MHRSLFHLCMCAIEWGMVEVLPLKSMKVVLILKKKKLHTLYPLHCAFYVLKGGSNEYSYTHDFECCCCNITIQGNIQIKDTLGQLFSLGGGGGGGGGGGFKMLKCLLNYRRNYFGISHGTLVEVLLYPVGDT